MVRPTYVEIDLAAVARNVRAFVDLVSPSKVCTVVKANAYGHGDVPVAAAALDAGAEWLAVALVEEGARLREAGIEAPILLLSEPPPGSVSEIREWELTPTVYSEGFATALGRAMPGQDVHLKIDTGMHRIGAPPRSADRIVATIAQSGLELAAMWTHFSVADSDRPFTEHQISTFDEIAGRHQPRTAHMANTPGAVLFPESRREMCRIGLGTYGLHPCEETKDLIELAPVMRLVSHVSHVQRLPKGARPSYQRIKPLMRDSTVVTIPIGYADGFGRVLSSGGVALIAGERHPLAGTVTMDQIVVDVGETEVSVGDEVVLLGSQGDDEVTADELAEKLGTISYEIVSTIGPRVSRRFL